MLREYDPYEEDHGVIESVADWFLEDERRIDILRDWFVNAATWAMTLAVLTSGAWVALL